MTTTPRERLIEQFTARVNALLGVGHGDVEPIVDAMLASATSESERSLLVELRQAYLDALHPTRFITRQIERVDETFEQCYELMRISFQAAELNPREHYTDRLAAQANVPIAHARVPLVLLGRFWRVSGPQRYDAAGRLARFAFDPLTVSEHVAGVISATYMTLLPPARAGLGIGAVGHLVTRQLLRRGGGHGRALVTAFEREVSAIAAARGETNSLLVLEAEPDAMTFWAKQGYRWPVGSRYAQPPLDFDPRTGERRHDEVPELLMVKDPQNPAATRIDSGLLRDAVSTLYENWCLARARTFAPDAAQRAEDYVGSVFAAFEASLPPRGTPIALGDPPPSIPLPEPIE